MKTKTVKKLVYLLLLLPLLPGLWRPATAESEETGKPPARADIFSLKAGKPPTDSTLRTRGRQISQTLESQCGKVKEISPNPESFLAANRAVESISALIELWNPFDNPNEFKAGYLQASTAINTLPVPAGHPMMLQAGSQQQTAAEYERNYALALAMLAMSAYLCQDTAKALSFVRTAENYAAVLPLNERDRVRLWDAGLRAGLALGDLPAVKQYSYRLFSEAAEAPPGDEVVMSKVWLADSTLLNTPVRGAFDRSAYTSIANYRYSWLHSAQALYRHGFYRRACTQARLAAELMRDDFDEFYCNKAYSLMAASAARIPDPQLAEEVISQILAFKPGMPDAGDFLSLSKLYHIIGDEDSAQKYYKKYQGSTP